MWSYVQATFIFEKKNVIKKQARAFNRETFVRFVLGPSFNLLIIGCFLAADPPRLWRRGVWQDVVKDSFRTGRQTSLKVTLSVISSSRYLPSVCCGFLCRAPRTRTPLVCRSQQIHPPGGGAATVLKNAARGESSLSPLFLLAHFKENSSGLAYLCVKPLEKKNATCSAKKKKLERQIKKCYRGVRWKKKCQQERKWNTWQR